MCKLAQLLRRGLRRRAHHQIFGALVHREQHDLAQVLFAAQQHDDAVDARRDAAVRRRAERERVQHAAEFLLQHAFVIAGDGESLLHHVRPMVADRAGGKLHAIADDVVLDRLECRGSFRGRRHRARGILPPAGSASKTDCGRSRSSSPPRSIRTSESRRSSRTRSGRLSIRSSSSPILVRAAPANLTKLLRLAGDEEHRIAVVQSELLAQSFSVRSGPKIVGDRTAADDRGVSLRVRKYSQGPAGLRPAPTNSCGRRRRASRRAAPGSPTPPPWRSLPGCAQRP